MFRAFAIAGSLALALVLGGVAWLTYGAEVKETVLDRSGDLGLRNGFKPGPRRVADIVTARVRTSGPNLSFEATMGTAVPDSIPGGFYSLTWDIQGETEWELRVLIGSSVNAFLLNKETGSGSSLETGGFPGSVDVDGDTIRVELITDAITGFPARFRWSIETELDVSAGEKGAGVVTDRAPDGRHANYRL